MKIYYALTFFQFVVVATMNVYGVFSGKWEYILIEKVILPFIWYTYNLPLLKNLAILWFHLLFQDGEFHATKNGGYCCSSDNVRHESCIVSTYPGGLGFEADFKKSECKTRCSNDADCKGYSIQTVNVDTETTTTSFDICSLYTTANTTEYCTFNQPKTPFSAPTSLEEIDENATCIDTHGLAPGVTMEYHEGCHIKIKVKMDNLTRGNKTDTLFFLYPNSLNEKWCLKNLWIMYIFIC